MAERACQQALAYARERRQGRRSGEECAIAEHLDVKRMLLSMRARTDALRALALTCASEMDKARHAEEDDARRRAQARVDVLIPVVKAFSTDQPWRSPLWGYRFTVAWGTSRRLAPLSCCATHASRPSTRGPMVSRPWTWPVASWVVMAVLPWRLIDDVEATASALAAREELVALGESLAGGAADLRVAMAAVLESSRDTQHGEDAIQAFATPFLSLVGHVLCAWQMGRAALVAEAALLDGSTDPFYRAKLAAADYALRHWLPVGRAQRAVIEAGVDGLTHYVPDID